MAIVASQIGESLFAFKNRCRSNLLLAEIDNQLHRRDTCIWANLLPSRTRKIRAPAPKQMRAASAGRVVRFHHDGFLLPQPCGQLSCPISDDDVRARAFERCHGLENGGVLIEQAFLGSDF